MPDKYIKQAEQFIDEHYKYWSDEGKMALNESLIIAIKNKKQNDARRNNNLYK